MKTNLSLGFTGARRDPVSAGYPLGNGYRTYLPGLMRFNAPDSLSPFGPGGVNPYVYCAGDPINGSDPSGHIGFRAFFKGIQNVLSGRVDEESQTLRMLSDTEPIGARNAVQDAGSATRPPTGTPSASQAAELDRVAAASYHERAPIKGTYDYVKHENYKRLYEISVDPGALPTGYTQLTLLGDSVGGGAFRLYKEPITLDFGDVRRTYAIDGGTALEGRTEQWLLAAIRSPFPHLNDRMLVIGLGGRDVMGDMEESLRTEYYIYGKERATVSARFGSARRVPSRSGDRILVPFDIDRISFSNTPPGFHGLSGDRTRRIRVGTSSAGAVPVLKTARAFLQPWDGGCA